MTLSISVSNVKHAYRGEREPEVDSGRGAGGEDDVIPWERRREDQHVDQQLRLGPDRVDKRRPEACDDRRERIKSTRARRKAGANDSVVAHSIVTTSSLRASVSHGGEAHTLALAQPPAPTPTPAPRLNLGDAKRRRVVRILQERRRPLQQPHRMRAGSPRQLAQQAHARTAATGR